jgi:hypothetical protein
MSTQATNPIVQVVDGNEQDIGLICESDSMTATQYHYSHE